MICTDCQDDGKTVVTIFEVKQMGHLCPECGRVYSPHATGTRHYATQAHCFARMRRDKKEAKLEGYRMKSLADRILKNET